MSETKSISQTEAEGKPLKVGYITLAVHNVKKEDAGVYTCKILDHNHLTSSTNYFVVVHSNIFALFISNKFNKTVFFPDKDTTYVDIDDTTLESETVASLEDAHVRWLVKYTSHPVAIATWLDPKRKPITASPKYLITNKINETSLTIMNITFEDAGNYSLILNNGQSDARRPFRLIIEGD